MGEICAFSHIRKTAQHNLRLHKSKIAQITTRCISRLTMTLTCSGAERSAEHHRVSGPAIWCRLQEHLSRPCDGGGGRGGGHYVLASWSARGHECHPSPLGNSPLLEDLPWSGGRPLGCGNDKPTRRLNEYRLLILRWILCELLSILWELLLIQLVLLLIRLEWITTRWRSGALGCKQCKKRRGKSSLSPALGRCY